MIASHVRSLILAAVFCTVGIASIMGMSAGSTPTTRPAATLADFAGWHAALPASRDLPARLALPGVLLEQVTRSFRTSLAGRRERYAVLAINASGGQVKTMSELVGGYHGIDRVDDRESRAVETVDIVGPICESGDFLARDRSMEVPEPGELLAVRTAGAYGFTMASNYNGRLRPAEVLVDGEDVQLIRRRETLEDLIRPEEELE